MNAALREGDGGFPAIVAAQGHNWVSREAESAAEKG
jgi:hypothetical protein